MPYADTDFFIGIAEQNDRLNASAIAVYQKYKGRIYTSLAVIIELALVFARKAQPVERAVSDAISIATLYDADPNKVMLAAHFIDKKGVGVFDAFHAALCDGGIISSDQVYDKIGIERIKL